MELIPSGRQIARTESKEGPDERRRLVRGAMRARGTT